MVSSKILKLGSQDNKGEQNANGNRKIYGEEHWSLWLWVAF